MGYSKKEGNDYTPSPETYVEGAFKNRVSCEDSVIDLGCGKGYAMYLMAKYPFSRIYGLEKSDLLAAACNHNLNCLFGNDQRFQVWNLDATEMDLDQELWKNIEKCTYVYIYNSFPQAVTKKVLQLLQKKCETIHWKVTIMYAAPSKGPLIEMLKSDVFFLEDIIAAGPRQLVYVFDSVYKKDVKGLS